MSLPLDLSSFQKDVSLDTLEKQLICPICLEVFTKPVVILPCQHNLCRKCANELYRVGIGGRFRCPSCRHEVVLDRHGVYGLQRNLLVENIIDVYKQESASFRPPPKPLTPITCEEHEGEKLNIYCITCQTPTCSLCKVFGAHSTCQVSPLPEVYQQQKAELSDGIASLVVTNERVQACISDLEKICRNLEENSQNQKQMLCEKFDRMTAVLEERRKTMVEQITAEQDQKTGWAQSLVQTYSEYVETNSKLMQTALNAMEESEMAAFLQASKSLIEQVSEAADCGPVETLEDGYECMDHYKCDFNAEEAALYQLDFLPPEEEAEEIPEDSESEPERQLEPEAEIDHEPEPPPTTDSPAPDQDLKETQSAASETRGDTQKERETDARCEKSALSTQQGQPGLGFSAVPADQETKLYPSWYRPGQMPSSDLACAQGSPDLIKEPSVQSQTPLSTWMRSTESTEDHGHLAEDSDQTPEVQKNLSEKDESTSKDNVTSLLLQTADAESSVVGSSSPAVTSESARLSFSFSWLNPLAKKK